MVVPTYGSVLDTTATTTTTKNTAAGRSSSIDPEVATADAAPMDDDPDYAVDATYYLKPDRRWTTRRFWNLCGPLCVAGLLVGGAALWLSRDFNHLYPGQGNGEPTVTHVYATSSGSSSSSSSGGSSPTTTTDEVHLRDSDPTQSRHRSHSTTRASFDPPNDGASCSLHPDCSMLTGSCCPTVQGKTLECCSV